MNLTKGKITKLYNKKRQTLKRKINKKKSSNKSKTFRRNRKINLARKSLKRFHNKKYGGGLGEGEDTMEVDNTGEGEDAMEVDKTGEGEGVKLDDIKLEEEKNGEDIETDGQNVTTGEGNNVDANIQGQEEALLNSKTEETKNGIVGDALSGNTNPEYASPNVVAIEPEAESTNPETTQTAIPVTEAEKKAAAEEEILESALKNSTEHLPVNDNAIYTKSIAYDHIPTITYFPTASTKIVPLAVQNTAKHIGYIDGAGDKIPEALVELGATVTHLTESDITSENLKQFDAIVVGIRAYNMYSYLTEKNDIFNDFVSQGGNLVVQYLKSNQVGIKPVKVGPYKFSVNSGKRVSQEEVPVIFTLPNHIVLNNPNKITASDFENWVQERSTYQSDNFDAHFEAPLTMNDKGEAPSNGSLLIAPYGKGNMVYLSLVLFRQLPAGNPGAYKLLANIISLPRH